MTTLLGQISAAYAGTGGAYDVVMLVISISIIAAGIAYGLGRAFRFRPMLNFGKEELFQQLVNIALVALLAGFVSTVNFALEENIPETAGIYETGNRAIDYSLNLIDAELLLSTGMFAAVTAATLLLGALVTIEIGICIPFTEICISGPLFVPLMPIYQIVQAYVPAIAIFIFLLSIQKALLLFFEASAFKLLLPLGVVLRSFKVTRGMGAMFIAVAVGFYIIYPLLFYLNIAMLSAPLQQGTNDASNAMGALESVAGGQGEYGFDDIISRQDEIESAFSGENSITGSAGRMKDILVNFFLIFMIQTVLLPLASLALTIIVMLELKEALTVDAGISALRMV